MNPAEEIKDSSSDFREDTSKTLPNLDPIGIIGELSSQRIESFFHEPSIEPEEDEEANTDKEKKPSTLSFALKKKKPIAIVPRNPIRDRTYQALQSWEGFVLEKFDNYFAARITDLNNEQMDEEVEISLKDVSPDDLHLAVPGAIFYWHIGYDTENGTTKRSSIIRFRRIPRWTQSDFIKAEDIEKKIDELFKRPFGLEY